MNRSHQKIIRGDVFYAAFDYAIGSETFGTHPVVIIQNNVGNYHSGTVIGIVLTSSNKKRTMPTHVVLNIPGNKCHESMAIAEHIYTIDKQRLRGYIDHLNAESMNRIEEAICRSLALEHSNAAVMCLCFRCLKSFLRLSDHSVRRVDPYQIFKNPCTYCNNGLGYDYWIYSSRY